MWPPFDPHVPEGLLLIKYGELPTTVAADLEPASALVDWDPQCAASYKLGVVLTCKDGRLGLEPVGAPRRLSASVMAGRKRTALRHVCT